ncbi:cytochrome P450 4c3-like [Daphnia carinata]|uniref:cytochrome P450 4c3-like n=1 Tax=Daphnia carinata TaxID=120202 RepID=UPI0025796618|nr:cytochrome P450 4c3-like [Daphnia carinata]
MFAVGATEWSPRLFCTTIAVLLAVWYWSWSRSRFVRLINAIPGPKGLPFLGNLFDVNIGYDRIFHKVIFEWTQKYDGIFRLWLTHYSYVVISSPELIEPILSCPIIGPKPKECDAIKDCVGDSLGFLGGEEWKQRRRMIAPAFHNQILNGFIDTFNEKSVEFARCLDEAVEAHKDVEFDIMPMMTRFALDILCETTMGRKSNNEEKKKAYLENTMAIHRLNMERILKPWLQIKWIFKMSALGRLSTYYIAAAHAFCNEVIEDRRQFLKEEKEKQANQSVDGDVVNNNIEQDSDLYSSRKRPAFLDTLLQASEENPDFTDAQIRDEVSIFMIAGHETVAISFAKFLYLMAKHPEHQQLMVDELAEVFGDSNRPCTSNDFAQLKYLDCCIKETMRLYPGLPIMLRSIPVDTQAGDYTIPKGATAVINLYATHHNPSFFPDPESFKPERFFPENSIGRHPYAFIPFSAGPRSCIGQKYAMYEMRVVMANLLRQFRFSVSDPSAPLEIPSVAIALKARNGVRLIASRRSSFP